MRAVHGREGMYGELRRTIVAAGLLQRSYTYYLARATISFAILAGGVGLAFAAAASAWAALPAAAAIIAFGSVQVALIGHDAGHFGVFKSRSANTALGSACWSLALGISFWYWFDRHTRHHTSTNDADADPDLQWRMARKFVLLLPFAFRQEGWSFTLHRLKGRRRAVELILLTVASVSWLMPCMTLGWAWLVSFLLSQLLAGMYLSLAIAPNHIGMPTWPAGTSLSFLERQLLSSRNVTPNPIWDFVFGGLNLQIEHHLFPTMPRNRLSEARTYVKAFCASHGLPYTELSAPAAYRLVFSELQRIGYAAATPV